MTVVDEWGISFYSAYDFPTENKQMLAVDNLGLCYACSLSENKKMVVVGCEFESQIHLAPKEFGQKFKKWAYLEELEHE